MSLKTLLFRLYHILMVIYSITQRPSPTTNRFVWQRSSSFSTRAVSMKSRWTWTIKFVVIGMRLFLHTSSACRDFFVILKLPRFFRKLVVYVKSHVGITRFLTNAWVHFVCWCKFSAGHLVRVNLIQSILGIFNPYFWHFQSVFNQVF